MKVVAIEALKDPALDQEGGAVVALAQRYLQAGVDLDRLRADSQNPGLVADPEQAFQLQVRLETYTKDIMATAGLVSHATKGVETLLKS